MSLYIVSVERRNWHRRSPAVLRDQNATNHAVARLKRVDMLVIWNAILMIVRLVKKKSPRHATVVAQS
jgi:hypothetical protein